MPTIDVCSKSSSPTELHNGPFTLKIHNILQEKLNKFKHSDIAYIPLKFQYVKESDSDASCVSRDIYIFLDGFVFISTSEEAERVSAL